MEPKLMPRPNRHGPWFPKRFSSPDIGFSRSELRSPLALPQPRFQLSPQRGGRVDAPRTSGWAKGFGSVRADPEASAASAGGSANGFVSACAAAFVSSSAAAATKACVDLIRAPSRPCLPVASPLLDADQHRLRVRDFDRVADFDAFELLLVLDLECERAARLRCNRYVRLLA